MPILEHRIGAISSSNLYNNWVSSDKNQSSNSPKLRIFFLTLKMKEVTTHFMTAYKLIDKIMPNMDKGITLNIKL